MFEKIFKLKNFISSKTFLVGVSFLAGLVLGYFLGLMKIHRFITCMMPKVSIDFLWLLKIMPSPTFLSDIAAFTGVVVGLSVPFSIDIILKVAERFKSETIPKRFKNEPVIKILPHCSLLIIIIAVGLRFWVADTTNSIKWLSAAFLILVFFGVIVLLFIKYIHRVTLYALDKKELKRELVNDMSKSIESFDQTIYLESLESYGDITVFETTSSNYEKVLHESLPFFENQVVRDLEKTEKILFQNESYKDFANDREEVKFRRYFDPQKHLISFATALNQINRVYLESLKREDDDKLSRNAVYSIVRILGKVSAINDRHIFVEQILQRLEEIMMKSIEKDNQSMYSASVYWYTEIVFNRGLEKENFQREYLELFDRYFFSTVRYIVSKNQTSLFNSLVSSLLDDIHVPDYHRGEVGKYVLILPQDAQKYKQLDAEHNITKQTEELTGSQSDLYTQEKLEAWLKKFDELKKIIEPNLNDTQKKEAEEIEENIRDFVISQFKYQNLLKIVFTIGAYCVFKQRYSYIKYLWEYKQPPDSDAVWIGHDITPGNINEVIKLYFRKGIFDKKTDFWEGRHGSEKYYKQYFLLLLIRVLQTDTEGKYSQIENDKLPDALHVYILSDMEYTIDGLIKIAGDLKEDRNMLTEVGFDTTKIDELFDFKLVPFLNKLKEEAHNKIFEKHKIGNISQKKL